MPKIQITFNSYLRIQRLLESNANFKKVLVGKKFPVYTGKPGSPTMDYPAAVVSVVHGLADTGVDPAKAQPNVVHQFAAERLFDFSTSASGQLVMTPIAIKLPKLEKPAPVKVPVVKHKAVAKPKPKLPKAKPVTVKIVPKPFKPIKVAAKVKPVPAKPKPKQAPKAVVKPVAKKAPAPPKPKKAVVVAKRKTVKPKIKVEPRNTGLLDNGPGAVAPNVLPAGARPMVIESDKVLRHFDSHTAEKFCAGISITNLLVSILMLAKFDDEPGNEKRREKFEGLLDEYAAIQTRFSAKRLKETSVEAPVTVLPAPVAVEPTTAPEPAPIAEPEITDTPSEVNEQDQKTT